MSRSPRSPLPPADTAALVAALRERLAVIGNHALRDADPAAHLEALKAASERLAALARALPPGTSPRLLHFLQQCSYDKALTFLENPDAPIEGH